MVYKNIPLHIKKNKEENKIKGNCSYCRKYDNDCRNYNKNIYCNRHYRQLLKYGKIIKTIFDNNDIIVYDTYAEILLHDINMKEVGRAIIDKDDINVIENFKWHYSGGYAVTTSTQKPTRLHQIIAGYTCDHIDRNKLNNKKSNLRKINKSKNMMNSDISKRNTSGVKGVTWDKNRNKWMASIRFENNTINLGRYELIEDAIKARLKAEALYFGEYSYLYNNKTQNLEIKYKDKEIVISLKGDILYEK